MANRIEHSSIPDAELNPLVNPLLAQNMGRWAEVYFNAAPEKREEAVLELLRELQAQQAGEHSRSTAEAGRIGSSRATSQAESREPDRSESATHSSARPPSATEESSAISACASCGHESRPNQRFCGMCGASFQPQAGSGEPLESWPRHESEYSEPRLRSNYEEHSAYSDFGGEYASRYQDADTNLDHMFELEPTSSHSYRIIIAGAVAIIAVVLVFMAWRSGQVTSALMRLRAEVPATTPQQQPATPQNQQPNPATPADAPNSAAPNQSQPPASSQPPPSPGASQTGQETTPPAGKAAASPKSTPKSRATEQPSAAVSATGNGLQELTIAQGYLNGQNANRGEAAQWLWKSVGKRNMEATLLLSDLYLHGEGVAKNCDQARILLDAAATRGSKEAGIRLRNLRAFGCQ